MPAIPSMYEIARQHAANYPHRPALLFGDREQSFADLLARVDQVVGFLQKQGVTQGDRVLWLGQNSDRVIELLLGYSQLGAALCIANWRQSVEELAFVVEDLGARLVLWQQEELADVALEVRQRAERSGSKAKWIAHDEDGPDGYEARLAGVSTGPRVDASRSPNSNDQPLLLLYTAAFDGKPSAAQLSDAALVLQALVHIPALAIHPGNVTLVSTPMFHIVAWLDFLPTFLVGGKSLIARRTDPEEMCRLIHEERPVTGRIHAPTAEKMVELNRDGRFDFSCFRSNIPLAGWSEMTTRGPELSGYGQTETAGPVVIGWLADPGNGPISGRPSPLAEVRIVDGDGRDVPDGEIGEIAVRCPATGHGYWNRPDLNRERTLPGGWWLTRDLGRRSADGTISFVAPKLHMIKTGAENVYPVEVESVLRQHPAVAQAAIIGIPDPTWHQKVTAIIEPAAGCSVDTNELIAHVKTHIARYKAPKDIFVVERMPMANGRPDYRALDQQFGGGNYPGQSRAD